MPKTGGKYDKDFDPTRRQDFDRLSGAIRESWQELEPMRTSRTKMLRYYAGSHYGGDRAIKSPVNEIQRSALVFTRQLVASNPQVLCTTIYPELVPPAFRFQNVMNKRVKEIRLRDTLRDVAFDALFNFGVVKIGLREGAALQFKQRVVRSTELFVDRVSPGNWVHDVMAPSWDQAMFFGDFYELPLEAVKRSSLYNPKIRSKLGALSRERGDDPMEEAEGLSRTRSIERLVDMIRLCDVWLPQYQQVVTMVDPSQGEGIDEPLRVVDWDGPVTGPYHILSFHRVPDNILPLGPAQAWVDLHEFENVMFRKSAKMALKEKTVFGYSGDASKDAENIRAAEDGEFVRLDRPEGVKDFKIGGASQTGTAMMMFASQLFNKFAGNVDALAGLGPQSETLGQDQMIQAAASAVVQDLQEKTVSWTKAIVQSMAFYVWHDPMLDEQFDIPVGDTGLTIQSQFTAEEVEQSGEFPDYDITISLYSLQDKSPSQRLQAISQIFQTFIFPALSAGILQQQGTTVNFPALIDKLFRYSGMEDEKKDLLKMVPVMPQAEPQRTGQNEKPAFQHKVVERVNRPGATPRQQEAAMANILMGNRVQDDEAAAIGRNVG